MGDSGTSGNRSVWGELEATSFPALSDNISVDICVIGGGIAGVCATRWLVAAGVSDMVLVEARAVASCASGRNAGFVMAVAPENFPTSDDPVEVERARRVWDFTAENQRLIEGLIAEFDLDAEYRRWGSLGLAARPEEWRWMQSSSELARRRGVNVEVVARDDLESEWLRHNYLGGAYYADNGQIHPVKFVRGLARVLAATGVRFFESTGVTMDSTRSRIVLRSGSNTITASRVLIATNAYTSEVLPVGGSITPTRGQVLCTAPLGRVVARYPVYADEGFQYWRQTESGRLVLGGWRNRDMEAEAGAVEALNPSIQGLLDDAVRGICGDEAVIELRWSGIMGFTPDRLPLVGTLVADPRVVVCAGFSGHGLAMAPHAAQVAARHVLGGRTEWDDLFDPNRFIESAAQSPQGSVTRSVGT